MSFAKFLDYQDLFPKLPALTLETLVFVVWHPVPTLELVIVAIELPDKAVTGSFDNNNKSIKSQNMELNDDNRRLKSKNTELWEEILTLYLSMVNATFAFFVLSLALGILTFRT